MDNAWSAMSVAAARADRRKHARHVERDIPVADDHHVLVTEIDWQIKLKSDVR